MQNRRINVVAAVMMMIVAAVPVYASASADEFCVGGAWGYEGSYATVPVIITNVHDEPVTGIEFRITFDSNVISLSHVEKGDLTANWSSPMMKKEGGSYVIGIVGATSDAIKSGESGSVIILNFSIVGKAGNETIIEISDIKLVNGTGDDSGTAHAKSGIFTVLSRGETPPQSPSPSPRSQPAVTPPTYTPPAQSPTSPTSPTPSLKSIPPVIALLILLITATLPSLRRGRRVYADGRRVYKR